MELRAQQQNTRGGRARHHNQTNPGPPPNIASITSVAFSSVPFIRCPYTVKALHRVRERLVQQRTGIINQIRAFLLERGIVVRQGLRF
jgi:hypothetical protein